MLTPLTLQIQGHCHQKALSSMVYSKKLLSLPRNVTAKVIPSGCCGMAGSFGYTHYDTSMKIGELVLFPALRNNTHAIPVSMGTSCRQQIHDGVHRKAYHPVEILYDLIVV